MSETLWACEITRFAADCGVSAAQLYEVIKAGAHGSGEIVELTTALGLDPEAVEAGDRCLVRDMKVLCTTCESKGECQRNLQQGTASTTFLDYCGNAEALEELLKRAASQVTPEVMMAAWPFSQSGEDVQLPGRDE